jgi:hypothetical protein
MNMRHLEKRVRKLESTLQCEPNKTLDYIFALQWFSVAYYLGKPSRHEKPFAAFARALGYANESELKSADNNRDLMKRLVTAEIKLYEKFNCDPRNGDWDSKAEAIKRMMAGLPKSYSKQIGIIVPRAKISLTWLRKQTHDLAAYINFFA